MNYLWILETHWKRIKRNIRHYPYPAHLREIVVGRPSGSATRTTGDVEGVFRPARLHLPAWPSGWATDERGPPAGSSSTSRARSGRREERLPTAIAGATERLWRCSAHRRSQEDEPHPSVYGSLAEESRSGDGLDDRGGGHRPSSASSIRHSWG